MKPIEEKQCYVTTSIAERGNIKLDDIIEIWFPEQGNLFYDLRFEYTMMQKTVEEQQ